MYVIFMTDSVIDISTFNDDNIATHISLLLFEIPLKSSKYICILLLMTLFRHTAKVTNDAILTFCEGYYPATSGTIVIDGHDITRDRGCVDSCIGFCPQEDMLYQDLTVLEHLVLLSKVRVDAIRNTLCLRLKPLALHEFTDFTGPHAYPHMTRIFYNNHRQPDCRQRSQYWPPSGQKCNL